MNTNNTTTNDKEVVFEGTPNPNAAVLDQIVEIAGKFEAGSQAPTPLQTHDGMILISTAFHTFDEISNDELGKTVQGSGTTAIVLNGSAEAMEVILGKAFEEHPDLFKVIRRAVKQHEIKSSPMGGFMEMLQGLIKESRNQGDSDGAKQSAEPASLPGSDEAVK